MRKWTWLMMLTLGMVAATANLQAATFTETLLEDENWVLGPRNFAILSFDLNSPSNQSYLLDRDGNIVDAVSPSTDAAGFVPEGYIVDSATLSLTFSSLDLWPERVAIYDLDDLFQPVQSVDFTWGELGILRIHDWLLWFPVFDAAEAKETAVVDIDLATAGLLSDLEDGLFTALVFAPLTEWPRNDIGIESASLTVDASLVPIPSALLLWGSGLIALLAFRRR